MPLFFNECDYLKGSPTLVVAKHSNESLTKIVGFAVGVDRTGLTRSWMSAFDDALVMESMSLGGSILNDSKTKPRRTKPYPTGIVGVAISLRCTLSNKGEDHGSQGRST